jgi:3-isopropylmalate dehydrogenase
MLASATIGGKIGLYEPVHGSAPDIEGKNVANPLGAIASAALMLRYAFKNEAAARTIELAVERVLADGYRTIDLASADHPKLLSTDQMGETVARYAAENANANYAFHAV